MIRNSSRRSLSMEFDVAYRNSEDLKRYLDDAYSRFGVMIKKLEHSQRKIMKTYDQTSSFSGSSSLSPSSLNRFALGVGNTPQPRQGFLDLRCFGNTGNPFPRPVYSGLGPRGRGCSVTPLRRKIVEEDRLRSHRSWPLLHGSCPCWVTSSAPFF